MAKKQSERQFAVIKQAKLYDVFDIFNRKPRQLAFNDTDAVVVTAAREGKEFRETFYTCIKGDGTFSLKTPKKTSHAKRQKLANFIKYYFKADPEEYNLKEKIKDWPGKKVELENDYIFVP